jgi:hypothetical protein
VVLTVGLAQIRFLGQDVLMNHDGQVSSPVDDVDEDVREAAVARLHDLFNRDGLSFDSFCNLLDRVLAAHSEAEFNKAMSELPPLVRLTPAPRRLDRPLILRAPGSELQLGAGWQLAADTTVASGCGTARLDLTAASWDSQQINLRLETWGSIEVLVPDGVAVQITSGSASVHLESLRPPVAGGPLLRVSNIGPTGSVRIRHPGRNRFGLRRHSR